MTASKPWKLVLVSLISSAFLAAATLAGSGPASATTVESQPLYVDQEVVPAEVGAVASGHFDQVMDQVHVDTGPREASVHGWWEDPKKNFPGKKAKVTIELQYKRDGSWRTVNTGVKTVKPGGGRGKRANARIACKDDSTGTWRSRVDVDVVGVADSPFKLTSPEQKRACSL
jgi:hypothetical protein